MSNTVKIPAVSIVIATFNSERTLKKCLDALTRQTYPKKYVDIIVADGGSTDKTRHIARSFGARVVRVDPKKQNAEYNKGVGLTHARGDIVVFLDHDNIIPHESWLDSLIAPLTKNPKIIGAEPLRFHYDPSMTVLDRYFALFGGSDPVVYYLRKVSHLSWADDLYVLNGRARDEGAYYEVQFTLSDLPALGGNGAALRRKLLQAYAKADPDHFVHTDVVADIVGHGFGTYAFIKDDIIHLTNNAVVPFLKRRKQFIEQYQFTNKSIRRYNVFDPRKDLGRLLYFIFISVTWIVPTAHAVRGFIRVPDVAWFLHPVFCFVYTFMYGWAVIERSIHGDTVES